MTPLDLEALAAIDEIDKVQPRPWSLVHGWGQEGNCQITAIAISQCRTGINFQKVMVNTFFQGAFG